MNADQLKALQIEPGQKRRSQSTFWWIVLVVLGVAVLALILARPWSKESRRVMKGAAPDATNEVTVSGTVPDPATGQASPQAAAAVAPGDSVLTVNGYIINRERIEISPRFLGVVKWIGVRKGDPVTNGQVVVLLDDTEFKARLAEAEGQLAGARAAVARDELNFQRVQNLARTDIESKQNEDNARLQLDTDRAALQSAQGASDVARTYVDWCVIRSPVNGVVMEKLVNPNELVMPQSFGGGRGPSTALIAVADPHDLQVEIDVNEADLSKIFLNQKCHISPEAYPDKTYGGYVAEIAPEADRAKGTLQLKVQIVSPDRFLTPELSAKVDFIKD